MTPAVESRYRNAALILFLLFCSAMIPGLRGLEGDLECWIRWSREIQVLGLNNAYDSSTNYPPLFLYVLWIYGKLASTPDAIAHYIGYLRLVTLAAEYWGLWLVYLWIGKRISYHLLLMCCLFNIAYSYNTLIWNQIDAIFAAFAFGALFFAHRKQWILSAILLILGLNLKLQTIVFVPVWSLMLLADLRQGEMRKRIVMAVGAGVLTQAMILTPFMFGRQGIGAVWKIVSALPNAYPQISVNAFNMWYWAVPGLTMETPDNLPTAIGLTPHQIGLMAFSAALLIALIPLIRYAIRKLFRNPDEHLPAKTIWLSAALSAMVFFFFNTQMHERYSHPAFIFLTAYAFSRGHFGLYILFSLAVLFNMEQVLEWFRLPNYGILLLDPRFVAGLFGGSIVWATVLLFRQGQQNSFAGPKT